MRYSNNTLLTFTKAELIEQLRCAEHNQKVAEEQLAQQAENVKDWVPVVRCRDCKYYTSHVCCHPGGMRYTCDSDYCSRAEFLCNQSADVRKMEGQPDEEP